MGFEHGPKAHAEVSIVDSQMPHSDSARHLTSMPKCHEDAQNIKMNRAKSQNEYILETPFILKAASY